MVILLVGCGKRTHLDKVIIDSVQTLQTKQVDVPVPLGANIQPNLVSGVSLGYTWVVPIADAVGYYQVEMVQLGWKLENHFIGPLDELMIFEKPYRSAAVSIKSDLKDKAVTVLILIKYKN